MTEQEIIEAINLIADNHEQGILTESSIISEELRNAIARLYTQGYNKGFGKGYDEAKSFYYHCDDIAVKVAKERTEKECRKEFEERIDRLNEESREKLNAIEKRHEKAAELLKQALDYIELDVYAWP